MCCHFRSQTTTPLALCCFPRSFYGSCVCTQWLRVAVCLLVLGFPSARLYLDRLFVSLHCSLYKYTFLKLSVAAVGRATLAGSAVVAAWFPATQLETCFPLVRAVKMFSWLPVDSKFACVLFAPKLPPPPPPPPNSWISCDIQATKPPARSVLVSPCYERVHACCERACRRSVLDTLSLPPRIVKGRQRVSALCTLSNYLGGILSLSLSLTA